MNIVSKTAFGMLLVFAMEASAMNIQGAHSGSWYNADQSGHGFSIEVLEDEKLAAYWFVYTPGGEPTFLVALADIDGNTAHGTLYQYSGMRFGEFDPGRLSEESWGSFSITFSGCDEARVTYSSTATHQGLPYGSGTIDLTRLTGISGFDCTESELFTAYGNYVANVMEGEVDIGDAEIMILKNGAMAYHFNISDNFSIVHYESGIGQLTMTSDTEFEFVTSVEYYGLYRELWSEKFTFRGSGDFSGDGVALEVPYGLSLNGTVDPAVYVGITMEQLAGTYEGNMPGDLMPRLRLNIAGNGSVTGAVSVAFYDHEVTGEVIIPDPGVSQFQLDFQSLLGRDDMSYYTTIGTSRGDEIYLITKHVLNGELKGAFVLTLVKH